MQKTLQRYYAIALIPVVCFFTGFFLLKKLDLFIFEVDAVPPMIYQILFVLSAVSAFAAPLFIRSAFAHASRNRQSVSPDDFFVFQKRLLAASQITPYFAVAAMILGFPKFYSAAIILMALYSVYYYYPSRRRIEFDRKIFRVKS